MGEDGLLVLEGDFYFQNNIKFFQGGVAPLHPHGEGNERESFTFGYSELLRTTPPVAERRQPPQRGGQPPSLRAQLSGGERPAPTEPAGETVPPKAAEGAIKEANSFAGGGDPAEPGRKGLLLWRFPPPTPSRKGNEWGRMAYWYGRGISIFKII